MARQLKRWQGWLLFGGAVVVVFVLGLITSSLMERRAEVANIFNNRHTPMTDSIVAQNEKFKANFPREYESWAVTAGTSFTSESNGSKAIDELADRPEMVALWAGYAFLQEYNTPHGHRHTIEDLRNILWTGHPGIDSDGDMQPGTCWTCEGPDVPGMMREMGTANFYKAAWSELDNQMTNSISCSDCHDARTMDLKPARPAPYEVWSRRGEDVKKATHQGMRPLVCAQCHIEYHFDKQTSYLSFPQDSGLTVEAVEAYYDKADFYDYIHPLSKTSILKAQHPGYEIFKQGIHAQRGVSCVDCHMPYKSEGGVKHIDHRITSPPANIDRTYQVCHRQSEEGLRRNVYNGQRMANEKRIRLEEELTAAHIEAKFAWDKGATEKEMKPVLTLVHKNQWRWDYGFASHGGSFHAPQEVMRIFGGGLIAAQEARLQIAKVLARHGLTGNVPMPDLSTKAKAQAYIGLDMKKLREQKQRSVNNIVPKWMDDARKNHRFVTRSM